MDPPRVGNASLPSRRGSGPEGVDRISLVAHDSFVRAWDWSDGSCAFALGPLWHSRSGFPQCPLSPLPTSSPAFRTCGCVSRCEPKGLPSWCRSTARCSGGPLGGLCGRSPARWDRRRLARAADCGGSVPILGSSRLGSRGRRRLSCGESLRLRGLRSSSRARGGRRSIRGRSWSSISS
jgi:hypothetical protein